MKKAKYIILLSLTILLTGCVKSNTSMTINKDKSMSLTSEVLISDKLLDKESKLIIKDEKEKLQKKNMTVEEIKNSNGYSGFSVTKKYGNIDKNSKEEYKEIIISNFFDDKFDDSVLFQVKKGLFKNVYTANYKFEVDNDDFVENNNSNETVIDDTTNTPTVENGTTNVIDNTNNVDGTNNNTEKDISDNADLIKLASEVKFKFSVNLPYKVLESNATKKSDDGKKLEWDLNSNDAVKINYSFELYNMNNIYMAIGISIGTIILLIVLIIIKNIIVEPVYTDYNIALSYTGEVKKDEQKDMKITISSAMGKNYEHTRIIANATTPSGGTVNLFATDSQGLEHDIIQNGWGNASGDPIGGVDVKKELNVRGLFNVAGDYSITLSLINRDDSDAVIESKAFTIAVTEKNTAPTEPENVEQVKPEEKPENNEEKINKKSIFFKLVIDFT